MWGADIRTSLRSLLKTPLVTLAILVSFGLSVSSTSVLFGVMDALVLKPLPFPDPDRIVLLWQSRLEDPADLTDTAPANFVDWRRDNRSFASLAAYSATAYNLSEDGPPAEVSGARVTPGFFASLGVTPRLGRDFSETEGVGAGARVAILSHNLWMRRFGGSPTVLGKRILLGDASYLVVGVMPPGWYLLGNTDVWTPLGWEANELERDNHYLSVVGRLRPAVSIAVAQQEMSGVADQLRMAYPDADAGYGITLKQASEVFPTERDRRQLFILMGIVAFVLLIACANIANLQLAKVNGRAVETATRAALGAPRAALVRLQLIEILILAMMGGLIAAILTALELSLLKASFFFADSWNPIGWSWPVFLFTFATTLLAGLVCAVGPALRGSRPDLNQLLHQAGRSGTRDRSFRLLGRFLVATEVMLAVGLLSVGGDMIVSFQQLRNAYPGFDPTHLLTARISLPAATYGANQFSEEQRVTRTLDDMAAHIASLPGVQAVAYATLLPRGESDPKAQFYPKDQRKLMGGEAPVASWRAVSVGFFQVLKVPLLEGRLFTSQDAFGKELVIVVSKAFAERTFPGRSAVGQQIVFFDAPRRIVGVVGNVLWTRSATAPPCIYLPHGQSPRLAVSFVARTQVDPSAIAASLPAKVWEVDPKLPVSQVISFEQYADLEFSGMRLVTQLLTATCLLAIVLATVGLYGLVSYMVSERTNDFAIRMALGGQRRHIFMLVISEAAKAAIPGIIAGALAVVLAREVLAAWFEGILHGGWLFTFLVSDLLVLTVGLASVWPAVRASFTDLAILQRS